MQFQTLQKKPWVVFHTVTVFVQCYQPNFFGGQVKKIAVSDSGKEKQSPSQNQIKAKKLVLVHLQRKTQGAKAEEN